MTEITVVIEPPLPDIEVTVSEVGLVGPQGPSMSTEAVQDIVGAMVAAGTGITVTYDDMAGTLTIAATGGGGGGFTQEQIEDFVGLMATDSGSLDFTYDDTAGTLTGVVKAGSISEAMLAFAVATQAELDAEATSRTSADTALDGRLGTVETALPLKADLVAGTVPDAQIHASIARDTEVTAAVAAEASARATAISTAINNLINSAPGTLDTLGEIATQLAADESTAAALATTVAGKQPLDADLTTIAAIDSTVAGALATDGSGWIRKSYAQFKTALGLVKGDVGLGNVDNTSDAAKPVSTAQQTALDAKLTIASNLSDVANVATARTNLGLGTAATHAHTDYDLAGAAAAAQAASQPLDSDLTAIAALTTTSFGRALLALADAAAGRTALGLGTAATSASGDFQPVDSDLTAIAALTTTSFGRSFLDRADAAAGRTLLGLGTAATVDTGTISGTIPLLGTGGVVPIARLATGTPDGTKFLRDDNTLAAPSAANGVPTGGTTGQVLAKTSSADYAQAWKTPGAGGGDYFQSGYHHHGLIQSASLGTVTVGSLGRLIARPFMVPVRRSFDRIGINVTTAASAGGLVRLGIYADAGGKPGALLLDAGTVATTSTGGKEITISVTLDAGIVWVAIVSTVATCVVTALSAATVPMFPWFTFDTAPISGAQGATWYTSSTVTGALPDPFVVSSWGLQPPLITLRAT